MRSPADLLASLIEAGKIPSASWLVGDAEGVLSSGALGQAVLHPAEAPAGEETIYDLASLTKPLVTGLLALILGRQAGIRLDEPVRRFLPEFDREDKKEIRLFHLLTHTSGLPDWAPLYAAGSSLPDYVHQIARMAPRHRPGAATLYSDPGYIALGALIEKVGATSLDRLARELIFERTRSGACFRPGPELRCRVAATEESCKYERRKAGASAHGYRGWREGVIHGEVHDQNAWVLGGVAGNAGLFGNARDVWLIAREILAGPSSLLHEEDRRRLARKETGDLPEPRSIAFRINQGPDGESDPGTAAGRALAAEAFGHNGFTGTSVWLDPRAGRLFVLLTNRVHPEVRDDVDMNEIRREFHRLAAAT